jgi:Ni/Co efflux regulator RcnB
MKRLHVALLALAMAVPSSAALAKDKHKDKHTKVKVKDDRVVVKHEDGRRVVFVDADRVAYRNWWRSTYGTNCPPGLARKDNGCLPPGLAKRRYVVGQALPSTIVISAVPTGVRLSPAPAGYRYAYVDGDLLLINATSRIIADVIANALD